MFGGRVYLKPDPSAGGSSPHALLSYYHALSPTQQEGLSVSLSAVLLLGGFWAVVALQQPSSSSSSSAAQRLRLYSTAAPVFRPFFLKPNRETHPALQPGREEAEFSSELAMLGLRLNELVSDSSILFVVESADEFASVCQKLAKSRQILRLAKTFDFSLEMFSHHPLHWKSSLEDDFIIRASCAIPPTTTSQELVVDYEPGSRRIACLKRAMNRRVYDAALLRVLFLGMRTPHNTSFDELIEPTTHSSVEITNGVWQRFVLLLEQDCDFVSCGLWFGSEPKSFERAVLRVSSTLSWAVVRAGGQLLLGDRGFAKLARYDVILDEDESRVYFNTTSVSAGERRELVELLNRLPVSVASPPPQAVDWFANRHWRICSTLPTTTTDVALHVVSTLKEAKRLLASRPSADLAIVVDGTIVVLQH